MKQNRLFRQGAFPFLFIAFFWSVGAASAQNVQEIRVDFDRPTQLYACGEEATVTLSVIMEEGQAARSGILDVTLTNDGRDKLGRILFNLAEENPATIRTTLDFPGFLQFQATVYGLSRNGEKTTKLAGAGFSPEKIGPGLPKPDDFDAYLAQGKKSVRDVPIDVQMDRLDNLSNEKQDVFSISFATIQDRRVYGFLSVPKTGTPPYPAIVNVPGAGPGTGPDLGSAEEGFIALNLNVFPYPVPLDKDERKAVYDKYNADLGDRYCYQHSNDRDAYFFRAAYLGIDRAIDWLAEREDVDAKRIGFFGASQGGASGLILGGMNKNLSIIISGVPALCDHAGGLTGRSPGWPRLVDHAKNDPNVLSASRYIDGVHFASMIDRRIKVTVGFIDVTCSPSSVYAAYNAIPSPDKSMIHEPLAGHQTKESYAQAIDWMKSELKK